MIFNVLKATEGGMGQKAALLFLKEAGIKAIREPSSCLVGHSAILVETQNKRVLARVERILYGR
jgi:hypothetical protein